MITWSELLQFTGVLISIAVLFYSLGKDNKSKRK